MKHILIISAFIAFFTVNTSAQNTNEQVSDSIIFSQLVYDYGTVEQGSDGISKFEFTNKGEKPLLLTNVRASCGCTVPTWPREPIQPGEKGVIEVKYNTRIVGSFNKSINVYSNAANNYVVLRIKGKVDKVQ